jgi:hypothetical protein
MRTSLLAALLFVLSATSALAAVLNLSPGESATIQPSVVTTVSCASGGSNPVPVVDCEKKAKLLRERLDGCAPNNNDDWCVTSIWPSFKQNNPTCLDEGISVCLNFCYLNADDNWCVQTSQ